ncbi:lytic murein transglycosylase [Jannaschia pohangensis]|uniref:Membrane-bound lytic murein transglycosylase B n=1 Tax=Jannaschia pohangensis TaxID=390807 RepID=A0A1I3NHF1_9RHOB|nr:lytic murein transglycosylase [Jannaschia pohangensis]SFJ08734.1 membrane-bound lytic murein transglycosylase B [Jannaschia pohangensis]
MNRFLICVALLCSTCPAQAQDRPAPRPELVEVGVDGFPAWLDAFRARARGAGIEDAVLDRAFADISYLPDVIRLDRRQSEFTKTIWEYLATAVSDERIRSGRKSIETHRAALTAIEAEFGVEMEIVTAIWGLESSYGAVRGDVSTLSALATLASDSRRGDFFEAQLLDALRILQTGEASVAAMRGSWAGAMGHTQFMPTSYQEHAVDFTGDGRRDIWGRDPIDALASTAAYLKAFGWTKGQPWGAEVVLPAGFDFRLTGERVVKSPDEWTALGVRTVSGDPVPQGGPASIRVPAGHNGAAFVTFGNFMVIERYNTADAYVIAVGHLADRLAGGPAIAAGWPDADRALSYDERIDLQILLRDLGFDPLKIDAKIGPDTLDAIQRWQAANSLPADGYVNVDLLQMLREQSSN